LAWDPYASERTTPAEFGSGVGSIIDFLLGGQKKRTEQASAERRVAAGEDPGQVYSPGLMKDIEEGQQAPLPALLHKAPLIGGAFEPAQIFSRDKEGNLIAPPMPLKTQKLKGEVELQPATKRKTLAEADLAEAKAAAGPATGGPKGLVAAAMAFRRGEISKEDLDQVIATIKATKPETVDPSIRILESQSRSRRAAAERRLEKVKSDYEKASGKATLIEKPQLRQQYEPHIKDAQGEADSARIEHETYKQMLGAKSEKPTYENPPAEEAAPAAEAAPVQAPAPAAPMPAPAKPVQGVSKGAFKRVK
jgi:hypothetical protein